MSSHPGITLAQVRSLAAVDYLANASHYYSPLSGRLTFYARPEAVEEMTRRDVALPWQTLSVTPLGFVTLVTPKGETQTFTREQMRERLIAAVSA